MGNWIFKLLQALIFFNVCMGPGSFMRELEEQAIETE